MSDEELCKRLVDWSEHDEGKINDARQEAKLRIEALTARADAAEAELAKAKADARAAALRDAGYGVAEIEGSNAP
jgi:hypothetical protein